MEFEKIFEYIDIILYILVFYVFIHITYTHIKFRNKIKKIENSDNISQVGPEDWKYDDYWIFFLNVIKTDSIYKEKFSELWIFKNLNEKESFVHSLIIILSITDFDRKNIILKEYKWDKEESFVKEFVDFWFENAERFKKTKEFKKIYN